VDFRPAIAESLYWRGITKKYPVIEPDMIFLPISKKQRKNGARKSNCNLNFPISVNIVMKNPRHWAADVAI